ncbi:MAG: radical SAM protein [Methylobacterium sp.]|nr:radical SAM protein [Methylobacterium sp.]
MKSSQMLEPGDHTRDFTGMTYVYPVLSRRAHGISVGINLNPNNACNWRCIYCQVPGLTRGAAPEIDLALLERELRQMLQDILQGNFMQERVHAEHRSLEDIAFSGNGEPTSSSAFPQAVALVQRVLRDLGLLGTIKVRLITNGSLIDRAGVAQALDNLAACNGEVWFKLDAATEAEISRINDVHLNPQAVLERLKLCASRCPTWVQTCIFALDGKLPSADALDAYLGLLGEVAPRLRGVHLYSVARSSMQPEAPRLRRLTAEEMEGWAAPLRKLGLAVNVSP